MGYMTWRDVRSYLDKLSESELNETATVYLEDPAWMAKRGVRAGEYPIYDISGGAFIDEEYWTYERSVNKEG